MKQQVIERNQLLEARRESLENAEKYSLRPLGKLWGMDVFTWCNPHVDELVSTVSTFPFPVMWMGNATLVQELAANDATVLQSMAWVAQFDDTRMLLDSEVAKEIPLITATENLADALTVLKHVKQSRHILLMTVSGSEWKRDLAEFEQFVKLHQ